MVLSILSLKANPHTHAVLNDSDILLCKCSSVLGSNGECDDVLEFSRGLSALITPFDLALAARCPLALCLSGHLSTSLFLVLIGTVALRRALVCFKDY